MRERGKERLKEFEQRIHFYNGWFNDFYADYPSEYEKPDLILFDLGISVFHYEKSNRGFSFRYDEKLDMRLNSGTEKSAGDLVNELPEDKLADLIYLYGEEKLSRRIAAAIVQARNGGKIESAKALAQIIWDAVPANYRYANIHPATRTFQALRIAVNSELKRVLLKDLSRFFRCHRKRIFLHLHSILHSRQLDLFLLLNLKEFQLPGAQEYRPLLMIFLMFFVIVSRSASVRGRGRSKS